MARSSAFIVSLRRIQALLIKEIAVLWNDKKTRILITVPPMIQLVIFAFTATMDIRNVHLAVYNKDHGNHGQELAQRLDGAPAFTRLIFIRNEANLRETMDSGKALCAVVIPQDFSRALHAGTTARVQIILDGRRSNTAQIVSGYLSEIIQTYYGNLSIATRASDAAVLKTAVPLVRHWYNVNLIYLWFTLPCLVGIITTMITMVVTALSVAREKEMGTFEQLLVSPLTPAEILTAKALPAFIIGMFEGSVLLAAAVFLFGAPMAGSLALLYASMFVFILSITGVGLFISSLSRTQQQAILGTFIFLAPAILLSGFATPVDNMPDWLQTATLANPIRHFLTIIRGVMLKDIGIADISANLAAMLLISVCTLTIGVWLFKRGLK